MSSSLNIIMEKDKYGYYTYCPELEGCHTQGDTFDEAMKNIKEAIELYVETLSEEERRELHRKEIISTSYEVSLV